MRRSSGVSHPARPGAPAVAAAFDVLRFGRENILDLRAHLPTGSEAVQRAEQFLRERQVAKAIEVLIITGRGRRSVDGVPVVRPAILTLLAKLRRNGVVTAWQEHTAGSFAVTPAPIRALLESARRHGKPAPPAVEDPAGFNGMDAKTRDALRRLAERSLHALGAPATAAFVQDEMQRHFSRLVVAVPSGPGRDARLRQLVVTALDELDDAE